MYISFCRGPSVAFFQFSSNFCNHSHCYRMLHNGKIAEQATKRATPKKNWWNLGYKRKVSYKRTSKQAKWIKLLPDPSISFVLLLDIAMKSGCLVIFFYFSSHSLCQNHFGKIVLLFDLGQHFILSSVLHLKQMISPEWNSRKKIIYCYFHFDHPDH